MNTPKKKEDTKLNWIEFDIKNPNRATHEWLDAHKRADEIVCDNMGNPWKVIYFSPISKAHQMMKESLVDNENDICRCPQNRNFKFGMTRCSICKKPTL